MLKFNKVFDSKIINISDDIFRKGKINVLSKSEVKKSIPKSDNENSYDYEKRLKEEIFFNYNILKNNSIVLSDKQYSLFNEYYANYEQSKMRYKNIILIGGVGSGKSFLNAAALFYFMSIQKPKIRKTYGIFGTTINVAKRIYMPLIRQFSGLTDLKEPSNNSNELQIGYHSIRFYGCKNEGDDSKFRGESLDLCIATEPSLFLYPNLQELIKRSRDGYVYWDTNPDDPNNHFMRYMEGLSMMDDGFQDIEDSGINNNDNILLYVDKICKDNNIESYGSEEENLEQLELQSFKKITLNIFDNHYGTGGFLDAKSYITKLVNMCKSETDIDRFIKGIPSSDQSFPFSNIAVKNTLYNEFTPYYVKNKKVVMFVDPAYSDKMTDKVDSTAVTILWKMTDNDINKFFIQGYLFKGNWTKDQTLNHIHYLCEFFNVSELWFEKNNLDLKMTQDKLKDSCIRNLRVKPSIHIVNSPNVPKKERIKNIDVLYGGYSLFCDIKINDFLDNSYSKYLYEISNFSFDGKNKHDDAPDSWESAIRAYNSNKDENIFKNYVYTTVPERIRMSYEHMNIGDNNDF